MVDKMTRQKKFDSLIHLFYNKLYVGAKIKLENYSMFVSGAEKNIATLIKFNVHGESIIVASTIEYESCTISDIHVLKDVKMYDEKRKI